MWGIERVGADWLSQLGPWGCRQGNQLRGHLARACRRHASPGGLPILEATVPVGSTGCPSEGALAGGEEGWEGIWGAATG